MRLIHLLRDKLQYLEVQNTYLYKSYKSGKRSKGWRLFQSFDSTLTAEGSGGPESQKAEGFAGVRGGVGGCPRPWPVAQGDSELKSNLSIAKTVCSKNSSKHSDWRNQMAVGALCYISSLLCFIFSRLEYFHTIRWQRISSWMLVGISRTELQAD